jgi:cell division protein FtsL
LEFLPYTKANEEEPHSNDNAKQILELQEELRRARARIEEQNKHIEDLQSELLVKDELIRAMQEKH